MPFRAILQNSKRSIVSCLGKTIAHFPSYILKILKLYIIFKNQLTAFIMTAARHCWLGAGGVTAQVDSESRVTSQFWPRTVPPAPTVVLVVRSLALTDSLQVRNGSSGGASADRTGSRPGAAGYVDHVTEKRSLAMKLHACM